MTGTSSGRLYRILSFDRAVQIFERGELHFAHPSAWSDPYEVRLRHAASPQFFGQCWSMKGVSDAMWRIYSPNHLGVRISTSTKLLSQQLSPAVKALGASIRYDKVDYLSQFNINKTLREIQTDLATSFSVERVTDALLLKRAAFDHEAEFRAILHLPSATQQDVRKGIKLKVDPYRLIDSVLLDPRAPEELAAAFTFYLKEKLKFKRRVAPSVLYKTQTPLVVEDE